MKVISAIYNEKKNAGPKAPKDINKILEEKYDAECIEIMRKGNYKLKLMYEFIKCLFGNDYIIIQHPLLYKPFVYNLLPKKRTIILIHDINGLRNGKDKTLNKELKIFKKFKYIIAHNNKMKEFLISKGIQERKIYTLEVFDYLANENVIEDYNVDLNELSLLYPGNLKKEKCPFIYQLDSNKMNFKINLYGLGIENSISEKLIYKGSFEPDDINKLEGDIGIIWDGNYDESDENELFKQYTKYNNPHKLSCCIALGIPVIVWKKAAISEFVEKNNIGYTINNLYDINNLDFEDYNVKRKNATEIAKRLRNGYYTSRVMEQVLKNI